MKNNIYNVVILDKSGSMQSIKQEAINGYNETLQTIKAAQHEICRNAKLFRVVGHFRFGIRRYALRPHSLHGSGRINRRNLSAGQSHTALRRYGNNIVEVPTRA